MLALSLPDRFMRGDPVFSQVVVRVGETRACLPGARGLAMVRIAVPCRSRDAIELGPQRIEGGVDVLRKEALAELGLVKLRRRHALPGLGSFGHARSTHERPIVSPRDRSAGGSGPRSLPSPGRGRSPP